MSKTQTQSVGELLKQWRQRRRMSQLELALEADISTRHLSFLETGRSQPSREMVLHLAEWLDVPLRDRNVLLIAAGYAPVFTARSFNDPALEQARKAVDLLLNGHGPFPALAIDRHWTLVGANRAAKSLLAVTEPSLLAPPVNVLRLSLHPAGLASRIANLEEWRSHLLARLRRQIDISADPALDELLRELNNYSTQTETNHSPFTAEQSYADVIVPLRLKTDAGILSFMSTTTIFGTAIDITLSEIALETFFPADEFTALALRKFAEQHT